MSHILRQQIEKITSLTDKEFEYILSHFVSNIPWAHFDIAGTAWTQDGTADKSYNPKGSTGFGIRTIIKFLEEDHNQ